MKHTSLRWPTWCSYLGGIVTGVPMMISGLRYWEKEKAYHGAQATVLGLYILLGSILLSAVTNVVTPWLGFISPFSFALSLVFWLAYYAFYSCMFIAMGRCMFVAYQQDRIVYAVLAHHTNRLLNFMSKRVRRRQTETEAPLPARAQRRYYTVPPHVVGHYKYDD